MTKEYISITEYSSLSEIMEIMFDRNIHTIPVIKENKLVGIIGKHDIEHVFF